MKCAEEKHRCEDPVSLPHIFEKRTIENSQDSSENSLRSD